MTIFKGAIEFKATVLNWQLKSKVVGLSLVQSIEGEIEGKPVKINFIDDVIEYRSDFVAARYKGILREYYRLPKISKKEY